MSHQDGLGNNGAEATGLSKPDDGDDRMQKKSENVAHGRNGIKLNKLENSGHLRNSPTTGPISSAFELKLAFGCFPLHFRPKAARIFVGIFDLNSSETTESIHRSRHDSPRKNLIQLTVAGTVHQRPICRIVRRIVPKNEMHF